MPQLIQNIEGFLLPYIVTDINYISSITGIIQQEDYINLYGYTAFLQNLIQTEYTQALAMPLTYGLKNPHNIAMVTLEIDY